MATEVLTSVKANVLLNDGSTASGGTRTITQSLGTLNPAAWDSDKVYAIASSAAPIFAKSIYALTGVKTYEIE